MAEFACRPAFDHDTDGCCSTPAIGPDGTVNGGLKPAGQPRGDRAPHGRHRHSVASQLSSAKPSGITCDPNV